MFISNDLTIGEMISIIDQSRQVLQSCMALISELRDLEGEKMLDSEAARYYLGSMEVPGRPAQPLDEKTMWAYRKNGLDYYQHGNKIWYKKRDLDRWRENGKVRRSSV